MKRTKDDVRHRKERRATRKPPTAYATDPHDMHFFPLYYKRFIILSTSRGDMYITCDEALKLAKELNSQASVVALDKRYKR